jgi:hypothetical protein
MKESFMNLNELEAKIKNLEEEIARLKDVEEIKKLQRIYGYYLDHHMGDEIVDLFSDDTESVETNGVYLGKEGARRLFKNRYDLACPPGWLARHMIQQGVIDVDPDGKTAKGRWGVFYCLATPVDGEQKALWGHGLYENEYVKENGKWKFRKFQLFRNFVTPYEDGWVKTPIIERLKSESSVMELPEEIRPDRPPSGFKPWPSTNVVPFHYNHPITGK